MGKANICAKKGPS